MKKPAESKIFDKSYYYNICFGSEEFKKSGGKKLHPRVKKMLDKIPTKPYFKVLEIGCGRGDTSLYIASKVSSVVGIDYSKEGINISNELRKKFPKKIQEKTKFYQMKAEKLKFKDNSFDLVLLIDTLDHLDKKGIEDCMGEINRVLKKDGKLFIRTCSNKLLLEYTYKYYIYPVNLFLTFIDKKMKRINYESLPKQPRTEAHDKQHVTEPTYNYLKYLARKYNFESSIETETGYLKEVKGARTMIYNFLISLYPISKLYPLNMFFGSSLVCTFKKRG